MTTAITAFLCLIAGACLGYFLTNYINKGITFVDNEATDFEDEVSGVERAVKKDVTKLKVLNRDTPQCPQGEVWNAVQGKCVPDVGKNG